RVAGLPTLDASCGSTSTSSGLIGSTTSVCSSGSGRHRRPPATRTPTHRERPNAKTYIRRFMLSRAGERDRTTDAGTRAATIAISATPSRTKAPHLAVLLDPEDEP